MFKRKCINPLNQSFVDHFTKLKKTAEYRHMKHIALCYAKIISSICKYPLPIVSQPQAMLLEGVGTNMAKIFQELLDQRETESNKPVEEILNDDKENNKLRRKRFNLINNDKTVKRKKEGHLFEANAENYLFLVCCYIHTLISTGVSLSITRDDIDSIYNKLKEQFPEQIKKESIKRKGNLLEQNNFIECLENEIIMLTTEGINKAKELLSKNNFAVDLIPTADNNSNITYTFKLHETKIAEDYQKLWVARPFLQKAINLIEEQISNFPIRLARKTGMEIDDEEGEVVLLIDTREVKTKKDRSYLYEQLIRNKISCEKRALPLGDALWIYRRKTLSRKPKEHVLNYIIERKKADDLASSIVDGRYIEQKHRLKESGISNVIYIVEGESTSQCRVSEGALKTAIRHTKVLSGFKVFRVKSIEETVMWLSLWTEKIKRLLLHSDIEKLMTYKRFCNGSTKGGNMTIQKVLSKQLAVVS